MTVETEAQRALAEADAVEKYLADLIARAPDPLRRLGDWLSKHLDEDEWKTAERYVLGAMESIAAPAAAQPPAPERFCNKCGFFGPNALHQRPNGTGQCDYLSMPTTPAAAQGAPIDMVLHCPACGMQHIDAPEEDEYEDKSGALRMKCDWTNPPHRSHLCHDCEHVWRPADVPTNGVQAVKTKGKADSPLAAPPALEAALCPDCSGSGVDGDAGDDGRTIDVQCGRCGGTGKASEAALPWPWKTEKEVLLDACNYLQHQPRLAEAVRILAARAEAVPSTKEGEAATVALRELVECKDLKTRLEGHESGGTDELAEIGDEYARRKPLAWAFARKVLDGNPGLRILWPDMLEAEAKTSGVLACGVLNSSRKGGNDV